MAVQEMSTAATMGEIQRNEAAVNRTRIPIALAGNYWFLATPINMHT